MDTIIETKTLCRQFKSGEDAIYALKNVNLDIKSGALTILKGRSGSGKTTLINLLGAIDYPTSGEIVFNGKDISKLKDSERDEIRRVDIGFVFQTGALMQNMNALENVEFALRVSKPDLKDKRKRAEECLKLVGLLKRKDHFPQELSGGEMQRIAIARAICHSPKVIFADEPTSALDTATGLQVVKLFKDMVEEQGLTIVMTTHDPNMLEIADYVYTLEDGEIVNG